LSEKIVGFGEENIKMPEQRTDKKKNAQLKVKKLYDISVTQDEADAILIGAWAVYDHNQSKIIMFE
jgi:hypothetical protein